jgi:hypothetical protein
MGTSVDFLKVTEKPSTHFGAYGGLFLTTLVFEGNFHPTLTNAGYPVSVNPTLGASFEVIFSRNLKRWSLYNEMGLAGYHVEGSYRYEKDPNHTVSSKTEIGVTQLRVNSMVRYSVYGRKATWFVNGGLASGFALSNTNVEQLETVFFTTTTRKTQSAVEAANNLEVGYLVGTGLRFGRLSTEIRYENGNGMSKIFSLASTTHKVFLLVGYRLAVK